MAKVKEASRERAGERTKKRTRCVACLSSRFSASKTTEFQSLTLMERDGIHNATELFRCWKVYAFRSHCTTIIDCVYCRFYWIPCANFLMLPFLASFCSCFPWFFFLSCATGGGGGVLLPFLLLLLRLLLLLTLPFLLRSHFREMTYTRNCNLMKSLPTHKLRPSRLYITIHLSFSLRHFCSIHFHQIVNFT